MILGVLNNGYQNCKVVSRGHANERLHNLVDVIKMKTGTRFHYHMSETKSLNKAGFVVNDLHVLISEGSSSKNLEEDGFHQRSRNINQQ